MQKIFTINGLAATVNNGAKIVGPNFPSKFLKLRYNDGIDPRTASNVVGSFVQLSSSPNIWIWIYNNTSWSYAFSSKNYSSELLEVIDGNAAGITNMSFMFQGCSALTAISIANTSSCTDMHNMFFNCSSLTIVPLLDTSSCTSMSRMFFNCSALTSIQLLNTSNVTDMYCMFEGCTSLITVPLFNTTNVIEMSRMFYGCSALTSVPVFDTSSCIDMSSMFLNCSSLTIVPLLNTTSCTNMNYMFAWCYKVKSGALALYQQASTQTTPPANHGNAFTSCGRDTTTGAAELAQIPWDWK